MMLKSSSSIYFLLQEVGVTLRKWRSNSTQLLDTIPEELREKSPDVVISTDPTAYGKTLGLHWNTDTDVFHIALPALTDSVPTKISIASAAAKLYDIMGWFGPVSLYVKILLQQLWESKLAWDDPIPAEYHSTWQSWVKELPAISQHPVPRQFTQHCSPVIEQQLHAFADASTKGYGGVIYLRQRHQDSSVSVALVSSNTRVASLKKQLTVPKLKLSAALLTTKLVKSVAKDLKIPVTHLYAWSHSVIVLGWLNNSTSRWKVFVSNRVTQILDVIPSSQWRHVPTEENLADHASRGLLPY